MGNSSMLPPAATPLMRAIEAVIADRYAALPTPHEDMQNPWACPAQFLPWLAWSRRVPFWNDTWSEDRKRQAIASSFDLNRLRGFVPGVLLGLEIIGLSGCRHIEWHEEQPEATPGTFRVELPVDSNLDVSLDASRQAEMIAVINRMKRRSQHFAVEVRSETNTAMPFSAALSASNAISATMVTGDPSAASDGLLSAIQAIGRVCHIEMRAD